MGVIFFRSLNCESCNRPFTLSDDGLPYQFACDLKTICNECVRRRFTVITHSCGDADCRGSPALLLREFLESDSLKLAGDGRGYILVKPIALPECPICNEEYSLVETIPFTLRCGHTVCRGCVKKLGVPCFQQTSKFLRVPLQARRRGPPNRYPFPFHPQPLRLPPINPFQSVEALTHYDVTCPLCQRVDQYKEIDMSKANNQLKEFLAELPAMVEQLERIGGEILMQMTREPATEPPNGAKSEEQAAKAMANRPFTCLDCKKEYPIDEMFRCVDCELKICGSCAHRRHRNHNTMDLVDEEVKSLSINTQNCLRNVVETYEKTFPHLHTSLINKIELFKMALLTKAEKIGDLGFDKANEERDECHKLGSKFEEISEKYLPNLRSFDTELQALLEVFGLGVFEE